MVKKKKTKVRSGKVKATARKKSSKPAARRPKARKSKVKIAKKAPEISLEKIGKVTHYFPHVKAAAVLVLKDSLKLGDQIYIKGHTTDFKEKVNSMQLDHVPIQEGKKGDEIGLLVKSRVRIGDSVYRL